MHMHHLVTLPVEVDERSAGKDFQELVLRRRTAGRRGAGWEPVSSWKWRGELAEVGSRSWLPGAGRGNRLCLQKHPPHNGSATAIPSTMIPPRPEILLFLVLEFADCPYPLAASPN